MIAVSPLGEIASTVPQKPVVLTELEATSYTITPALPPVAPVLFDPSRILVPVAFATMELGVLGRAIAVPTVLVLLLIGTRYGKTPEGGVVVLAAYTVVAVVPLTSIRYGLLKIE